MTKKKITFWACDYSDKTGEGNLARKFIFQNYKGKKIQIKTINSKNIFKHKYLIPFIGIINCWKYFLKNHNVGYLNYLPLWNFLIFFLLPPKTSLGPITGGALYSKKNKMNYFIRNFFFPIFYKLSEFIINIRFEKKIIFSTDLLKKYLSKKTIKKSEFNFVLKNMKFKKKKTKDIDLLIYHKIHDNKSLFFDYDLISYLTKHNLRIIIIGDRLNINGVKNLGYLNQKKLSILQSRSKYSLCSGENIYSLFVLECITNHVKILINKDYMRKVNFFKKFFITLDKSKLTSKKLKM